MNCPICKTELLCNDDDRNLLITIIRLFEKYANPFTPFRSLKNIAIGSCSVGKAIYYDFSAAQKIYDYYWCPKCKLYFLRCPNCYTSHPMSKEPIVTATKVKCSRCNTFFVYLIRPYTANGAIYDDVIRPE